MLQARSPICGTFARNWGELLSDQARLLREQMRGGAGLEEASRELHLSLDQCRLAIALDESEDVLKLRAIVEDWPRDRIEAEFTGSPAALPLQR